MHPLTSSVANEGKLTRRFGWSLVPEIDSRLDMLGILLLS